MARLIRNDITIVLRIREEPARDRRLRSRSRAAVGSCRFVADDGVLFARDYEDGAFEVVCGGDAVELRVTL